MTLRRLRRLLRQDTALVEELEEVVNLSGEHRMQFHMKNNPLDVIDMAV